MDNITMKIKEYMEIYSKEQAEKAKIFNYFNDIITQIKQKLTNSKVLKYGYGRLLRIKNSEGYLQTVENLNFLVLHDITFTKNAITLHLWLTKKSWNETPIDGYIHIPFKYIYLFTVDRIMLKYKLEYDYQHNKWIKEQEIIRKQKEYEDYLKLKKSTAEALNKIKTLDTEYREKMEKENPEYKQYDI